jgi:hypothetical protein
MKMNEEEFKSVLIGASRVPDCPTEKFVSAFHAQMDYDLAQANTKNKKQFLLFGSMAAGIMVAALGGFMVMETNFKPNVQQIAISQTQNPQITPISANATLSDAEIVATIDKEIAEDEFVAQLTGAEDISTILAVNEL